MLIDMYHNMVTGTADEAKSLSTAADAMLSTVRIGEWVLFLDESAMTDDPLFLFYFRERASLRDVRDITVQRFF
jgi:hypothetical protein